jgi:hypothetical protein
VRNCMLSLTFVRQEGLKYRLESDEVTPTAKSHKIQNHCERGSSIMSGDMLPGLPAAPSEGDDVPDELLPFAGKLSPRFYEVRRKVLAFCEIIQATTAEYNAEKQELLKTVSHEVYCPEPKVVARLREEAKKAGLYNFFLPQVYAPCTAV